MTRCHISGKECFVTCAKAYTRLAMLSKRHRDRMDNKHVHGPLNVYRCACGQFHVGHKSRSAA